MNQMSRLLNNAFLPYFCIFLLSSVTCVTPTYAQSGSSPNTEIAQANQTVVEWFEKYDAIRRNAEMSAGDKLKHGNALKKALKSGDKISAGTKTFVEKMRAKYEAAAAAIKQLPEIPETKELQEGYIQYFTDMEHSFAEITTQDVTPASSQTKAETKANLEKLSAKNKALDASLRTKYGIEKHKHS